jgi:hypothetical protein
MHYHRITEILETSNQGDHLFSDADFHDFHARMDTRKRTLEGPSIKDDEMSNFKRVRVIAEKRIRAAQEIDPVKRRRKALASAVPPVPQTLSGAEVDWAGRASQLMLYDMAQYKGSSSLDTDLRKRGYDNKDTERGRICCPIRGCTRQFTRRRRYWLSQHLKNVHPASEEDDRRDDLHRRRYGGYPPRMDETYDDRDKNCFTFGQDEPYEQYVFTPPTDEVLELSYDGITDSDWAAFCKIRDQIISDRDTNLGSVLVGTDLEIAAFFKIRDLVVLIEMQKTEGKVKTRYEPRM